MLYVFEMITYKDDLYRRYMLYYMYLSKPGMIWPVSIVPFRRAFC